MKVSKVPVWYLLQFAEELIRDASRSAHIDPVEAEAWVDQAMGIQKALDAYRRNGGTMSRREIGRLVWIDEQATYVADTIPALNKVELDPLKQLTEFPLKGGGSIVVETSE